MNIDILFGETFSGLIFIATLVFVVTQYAKKLLGNYVTGGEKHGDLIALAIAVIYCVITGTGYLQVNKTVFKWDWAVYVDQVFSGFIVAYIASMERNILKKAGVVDQKQDTPG
ncbi:hypothetical protein [Calorimonas adulescens]|uniref:Uncharacterized protein n=1 Tax=Calorimonas adulescens TaxID=2606906 RepID=A0A5D8QBB2_9THEO|nr:hypothetical protein [Calorimonas adulescens]TZE82015.1 hypothetical protein FWJ32_07220 [Calorimonas adulescens]